MRYPKYFFILFTISFTFPLSAQLPYTPFPEEAAVWHVAFWESDCPIPFPCQFNQYSYNGDTVITGLLYHNLSFTYKALGQIFETGIIGYIRQDSSEKKVFYLPSGESNEYLLYDFNLNVGDIYPKTFNTIGISDTLFVFQIDSLLLNGDYRRFYKLIPPRITGDTLLVIEGIGCTSGLINTISYWNGWEYYSLLTCFQEDGETVYSPYGEAECQILGIKYPIESKVELTIVPNPVNQAEMLIISSKVSPIVIRIRNLFGQHLWENAIATVSVVVPVENFGRGLVIAEIYIDGKIIAFEKVIVY